MPFTVYEFNSYIDLPGKRVKSKKTSFSIIIQASTKFKLLNCLTVSCFDDSTMKQSVQKYTTHPKVQYILFKFRNEMQSKRSLFRKYVHVFFYLDYQPSFLLFVSLHFRETLTFTQTDGLIDKKDSIIQSTRPCRLHNVAF